jgi:hypothetical protein
MQPDVSALQTSFHWVLNISSLLFSIPLINPHNLEIFALSRFFAKERYPTRFRQTRAGFGSKSA